MFAVSLAVSLWAAWRGAWGRFRAAYGLAWATVVAGGLFVVGGSHGTHGSPGYMIAWGLIFLLPFLALAALLTGILAFIVGAVGARRRSMADDEVS